MWFPRTWEWKGRARSNDLLRGTRQADGPRTGAPCATLPAFERNHPHRDRHGVLPGIRRRTASVRGSELLPLLRAGFVAAVVESGKEKVISIAEFARLRMRPGISGSFRRSGWPSVCPLRDRASAFPG